jgi:acetoin utilization deacetylase AcuC-like enzyme
MTDRRLAAILRSRAFLLHDTGDHVENPTRLPAIDAALESAGLLTARPEPAFAAATLEQAARVHDPRYLDALAQFSAQGGGWIDGDTYCGPESFDVALLAAGAAVSAVDLALDGSIERSFVLARPPGHHATINRGMGFCLVNSIAVAAAHAVDRGLQRVAIVDWDVHHGNGTQDIFYARDDVLFCSVHQFGFFYPGSGAASERGTGDGSGYTINAPLAAGARNRDIERVFDEHFHLRLIEFNPEFILISAGFDAHKDDPLGGMLLTDDGFARLAGRVVRWAEECGHHRVIAVLEGGYDPSALGRCVAAVLRVLDGEPPPRYSESNPNQG